MKLKQLKNLERKRTMQECKRARKLRRGRGEFAFIPELDKSERPRPPKPVVFTAASDEDLPDFARGWSVRYFVGPVINGRRLVKATYYSWISWHVSGGYIDHNTWCGQYTHTGKQLLHR